VYRGYNGNKGGRRSDQCSVSVDWCEGPDFFLRAVVRCLAKTNVLRITPTDMTAGGREPRMRRHLDLAWLPPGGVMDAMKMEGVTAWT